jgi:RNase_H superfamily
MVKTTPSKIVFLDIETAPSLGWVWAKWQTDVIDFKANWYILSFAVKEAGKKVQTYCLADFPGYEKDKEDDTQLVKELWKVLESADIIVAHNGDRFDLPKINTRFLTHGMQPPSPYKTVDTLQIARKVFKFDSNKLDELGRYLGVGRKLAHTGFHLWKGCMEGDPKAWKTMKRYNGRDVILLEKIYFLMRPWAKTHPNVNQGQLYNCPKCGSSKVQRRGWSFTLLRKKQRMHCQNCAGWFELGAMKVEK